MGDEATAYAIGFLEQWIDSAGYDYLGVKTANDPEVAKQYLRVIDGALREYRRKMQTHRSIFESLKMQVDSALV
jgi:hypothetical protein